MRDRDPFEDDVRALLREARQLDPDAPSFGRMWRHAEARRRARPGRRSLVPALGAALMLTVVLVWLGTLRNARSAPDVEALLASLRTVDQAPLDFLLDTPGAVFVHGVPRFGDSVPAIDPDLFQLPEE